ncbi:class I SAM-dependent methyltransferase, partial [Paenibacillus sepulcri]|nr:class I SAM-dependent methyltransferase [Paenibacillus sepulcri]
NACVIGAVSLPLWREVEDEVKQRIHQVAYNYMNGEAVFADRLRRMRSLSIGRGEDFDTEYDKLAGLYDLDALFSPLSGTTFWYAEPALQDFSLEQFLKVMALTLPAGKHGDVKHISFEKLMNAMYYDYKGAKKINIYKKRIIEKYLSGLEWTELQSGHCTLDNPHLAHHAGRKKGIPDTVFFEFVFSPAAGKLIEFCVEAEKSAIYEQAVLLLFDLFGLRRDAYDRFHNEDVYLSDMNRTAGYKSVILEDIVGERLLDIGPGGGVLLDLIEERLPDVKPVGIDISTNVVEALNRKKQLESRRWEVMQGDALNLKEYVEPGTIDTVIFSSILHELYSYIPMGGRKFNRDTIAAALRSAFDVLSEGGRIIIRDGIMTEPAEQKRIIRFLREDGMQWLERYSKDFAGRRIQFEKLAGDKALLPVNDAMEFLYTYTWGEEAYVHEIQEQFGYFTLSEYTGFIAAELGEEAVILKRRSYLQEGYTEALAGKVEISDEHGNAVPLPDSTCLIVIEKAERQ